VVVFPAPFGPRNPTHFDPSIFRFRLETATKEPKFLERFTASTEGLVMATTYPVSFILYFYLVIILLKTGTAIAVITTPNTISTMSSVEIAGIPAPSTITFLRASEA
jgi:hypothetical protein